MPQVQRSEIPRPYVALAVFSLLPAAMWLWMAASDDRLRELYLWIAVGSTLTCCMPLALWWARWRPDDETAYAVDDGAVSSTESRLTRQDTTYDGATADGGPRH